MIEQRLADRTDLSDTTVQVVDVESGVEFRGEGLNVSGGGLSFKSELEPPVGADMKVTLKGARTLSGELRVTRVEKQDSGYAVAGKLSRQR
jgi:PilZ domain